jgi:hypothetical protein
MDYRFMKSSFSLRIIALASVVVLPIAGCSASNSSSPSAASPQGTNFGITGDQVAQQLGCLGFNPEAILAADVLVRGSAGTCSLNGSTVRIISFPDQQAQDASLQAATAAASQGGLTPGNYTWASGPGWAIEDAKTHGPEIPTYALSKLSGQRTNFVVATPPPAVTLPPVAVTIPPVAPKADPPPAAKAKSPQGDLVLSNWQNGIEYSDTCGNSILYFDNNSDTAVLRITVNYTGENSKGKTITLRPVTFSAGIAPFSQKTIRLEVCDARMGGQQYGPSVIPKTFSWDWAKK